jgi:hypothetical protein
MKCFSPNFQGAQVLKDFVNRMLAHPKVHFLELILVPPPANMYAECTFARLVMLQVSQTQSGHGLCVVMSDMCLF